MRLWSLCGALLAALVLAAGAQPARSDDGEVRAFVLAHTGGHLGVALDEVDAKAVERLKLKEERGALVREVRPESPAAKAGLKVDDVIVAYQGEPVESAAQLTRLVRETPAGRTVTIEIAREGATQKLKATLDDWRPGPWGARIPKIELPDIELPHVEIPDIDLKMVPGMGDCPWHAAPTRMRGPRKLGIEYQEISGQLAEYFKIEGQRGLLIVSVDADGPAAKAGVKAGDVLQRVGAKDVTSSRELRDALADASPGEELGLSIRRDGRPLELKLVVGGPKAEPGPPPAKVKKKERT